VADTIEVRDLLPHRYPILLVDSVVISEPPDRVVTAKTVTSTEPCYAALPEGLARSGYAYPSALLLESFAQSCGILWRLGLRARGTDLTGLLIFGSARDVVFLRPVYPGQTVLHEVRLDDVKGDNAFLSGESWVDGECVATVGSAVTVVRSSEALAGAR
jgi:3-hydroxyacyl-[acyl-carrier-protein] dehydratase